jgi:hypothetical protein
MISNKYMPACFIDKYFIGQNMIYRTKSVKTSKPAQRRTSLKYLNSVLAITAIGLSHVYVSIISGGGLGVK